MPLRYQICVAKCLYSCRCDLLENLDKTSAQKVPLRLTSIGQKRPLLKLPNKGLFTG